MSDPLTKRIRALEAERLRPTRQLREPTPTPDPDALSEPRMMTQLTRAQLLIGAVRAQDDAGIADIIARADVPALLVTLAAMVPDDQTPKDLLAWRADGLR